jgi:hypothetical protein
VIDRRYFISGLRFFARLETPDEPGVIAFVDFQVDGELVKPFQVVRETDGRLFIYGSEPDSGGDDPAWMQSEHVRERVSDFVDGAVTLWRTEFSE